MGLFDQLSGLASAAAGTQGAPGNPVPAALLGPLSQMLAGNGLQGLLGHLSANGLGGVVASWVSVGQNQPVTPDQLRTSLAGSDLVAQLAAKTGLSGDALHAALAQLLPHVVDHLTPGGAVQAPQAQAPDLSALVGKLFG